MNYIPKIEYTSAPITITFELPPEGDNLNEKNKANERTTYSDGGVPQTQFNYFTRQFKVRFRFLTQALQDELKTFFLDHAGQGLEFKYFESSDEVEFSVVTMSVKQFNPQKQFPDGSGGHIWDVELSMIQTL